MIHDLGRRLITDLSARTPDQNVLVSPASIGMALALIASGARGETRAAILAALGAPDASQEQLDHLFVKLGEQLSQVDLEYAEELMFGVIPKREPAARVDLANGLWLSKDTECIPAFVEQARQIYQAELSGVDFGADETSEIINRWVSERTRGNINRIVDWIDPLTSLILINAVYFKGAWTTPFDAGQTEEAPFTLLDGSQIVCDLMYQSVHLPYVETETFQLVLLPIAGARFQSREGVFLAVVLPRPGKSCAEALEALGDNWVTSLARQRQRIAPQKVLLWLPRFRINYATSLNATLDALGMGLAFSDSADFSGITPSPTRISEVQHKTTLLVNERGAEAAAATKVEMQHIGIEPDPAEMRVDRPFVCGIVLNPYLAPLFLGVINQPERTDPA